MSNKFSTPGWEWCDNDVSTALIDCGFTPPPIKMSYEYTEVISPDRGKYVPSRASICVPGDSYLNFLVRLEIADPKKAGRKEFDRLAADFVDKALKATAKGLPDDVLKSLLWQWKRKEFSEKVTGSRDIGIGSAASTHVDKEYSKTYAIRGLEAAFGGSRKRCEEYVRGHGLFKKDKLTFDWKAGILGVEGSWTDVYD